MLHWPTPRKLQSFCIPQDSDTLFFGPRKHIQDLWALVEAQKKHILDLEHQLCSLGVQPKRSHKQQLKRQHHQDQRPAGSLYHANLRLPTSGSKARVLPGALRAFWPQVDFMFCSKQIEHQGGWQRFRP